MLALPPFGGTQLSANVHWVTGFLYSKGSAPKLLRSRDVAEATEFGLTDLISKPDLFIILTKIG